MEKPGRNDLVRLATIGAAHGVKGEVRVRSFAADPGALNDYGPLLTEDGRRFAIERMRPAKGDMLVVKLAGIGDRSAAEALNGLALYVARSALPAPGDDEFYHADLIGLTAVDTNGDALGTIIAVHDFGGGDMLDIKPARGPSMLVPFTRAAVPEVDIAAGRATIQPPAEIEVAPREADGTDEGEDTT